MKLYSNIHNQTEKAQTNNPSLTSNGNFTLNPLHNVLNVPQQSQVSNLQLESNKQLEFGLAALNLYMLPNHISVVDQEDKNQQFYRVVGSATRSTTPRKKIFNEENILYKLMEPVSQQIKQQVITKPVRNKSQIYEPKPPKDVTSYIQPREKLKNSQTLNKTFQKRLQPNMRKISKEFKPQTKEQKQQTYRILAGPILYQERQGKSLALNQSMQPQITRTQNQFKIPEILQRIDRNQRAILQLRSQVNQLVRLQNEKQSNLRKQLLHRQRLIQYKQSYLQDQIRQIQNQQQFGYQRIIRNQLQKQQASRIKQLVEENKLLSQKILEQTAINRKNQPKQHAEYLRKKIAQLQLQREAIEKDKIKNLKNLDISIIPQRQHHFIPKNQLLVPTNQPPQLTGIRYLETNSSIRATQQTVVVPDYRYQHLGIREVKVTKMF